MIDFLWIASFGMGLTMGLVWGATAVCSLARGIIAPTMMTLSAAGFGFMVWAGEHLHG